MTAESMMLQGVPAMSSWREELCWAASAILGVGAAEPIAILNTHLPAIYRFQRAVMGVVGLFAKIDT